MLTDASPSLTRLLVADRPDRTSTYAQVDAFVDRCRSTLVEAGFPFKANSALGSVFAKASKLNKAWIAGTHAEDVMALIEADEAYRIAEAVMSAIDEPAAGQAIRRITKSDMRLSVRAASQGKDALWELSLATSLKSRRLVVAYRDPPDLEVDLGRMLGAYGIACKKVYSLASVEKQFSKGLKQLEPYRGAGLVAFNLDEQIEERRILVAPTRAAAGDALAQGNKRFIDSHRRLFEAAVMDGRCDAVLVSSCAHADIRGVSPRFNRITEHTLWTVDDAGIGSRMRLDAFRRLLGGVEEVYGNAAWCPVSNFAVTWSKRPIEMDGRFRNLPLGSSFPGGRTLNTERTTTPSYATCNSEPRRPCGTQPRHHEEALFSAVAPCP